MCWISGTLLRNFFGQNEQQKLYTNFFFCAILPSKCVLVWCLFRERASENSSPQTAQKYGLVFMYSWSLCNNKHSWKISNQTQTLQWQQDITQLRKIWSHCLHCLGSCSLCSLAKCFLNSSLRTNFWMQCLHLKRCSFVWHRRWPMYVT